jgi:hypothetical protein
VPVVYQSGAVSEKGREYEGDAMRASTSAPACVIDGHQLEAEEFPACAFKVMVDPYGNVCHVQTSTNRAGAAESYRAYELNRMKRKGWYEVQDDDVALGKDAAGNLRAVITGEKALAKIAEGRERRAKEAKNFEKIGKSDIAKALEELAAGGFLSAPRKKAAE